MAVTIEELLINLGVDVSGFKSGIDAAAKSFDGLTASGAEAESAFKGIQDVTENLAASLEPVADQADKAAAAVAAIGEGAGQSVDFSALGTAIALTANEMQKLEAAGFDVSGSLKTTGEAAKVSDAAIRGLAQGAQRVTISLAQVAQSGAASAATLLTATRGLVDLARGTSEVAASSPAVATGLASIGTSLSAIAGAVAAPIAAVAVLQVKLRELSAAVERENARTQAFLKDSVAAAEDTAARLRSAEFELELKSSGFTETEEALSRFRRSLQDTQAETKKTDAQIEQLVESEKQRLAQLNFDAAKQASQEAGKALTENIRAGVDGALAEFERLKVGIVAPTQEMEERFRVLGEALSIRPAEDVLQGFRDLAKELDFTGPLSEMQALQAKLEEVRRTGQEAFKDLGTEEAGRKIRELQELIKSDFVQSQKLKLDLDPTAAQAAVDAFLESIGGLPPTVLRTDMDVSEALRKLDVLRAKIADTPDGELKVALKAEAAQLDAALATRRSQQEGDPIDIPVNADTTEAEAALARLRQEAAKPLGIGGKPFFQEFGDAASGGEVRAAAGEFASAVADALASANVAALRDLKAQGDAFVKTFAPSFDKLRQLGGGGQYAQALREIQDTLGALRFVPLSGPGGTDLTSALSGFFQKQTSQTDEQIAQQRETNDLARAQLETTQRLNTSVVNSATSTRETLRIATGVR